MRSKGRSFVAVVVLQIGMHLGAASLAAASPAPDETDRQSVYEIDPLIDGPIILAGAAATAVPYALATRIIDPRCPCDRREVDAWDRSVIGNRSHVAGLISDLTVGAAVIVPVAFELLGTRRPYLTLIEDLTVYAEVLAINGAAVTLVKHWIQRPLPRTYEGTDDHLVTTPYGYRAFYSGHTATAFAAMTAAAMTAGYRHGHRWWPWLATVAVGSTVAVGRVLGGHHFYSDVFVGAIAGTTVGVGVPLLHRRREPGQDAERWVVTPHVQIRDDATALLFSFAPR